MRVKIIGVGLAGCEVTLQLSNRGIQEDLYEMESLKHSETHNNSSNKNIK